MKKIFALVMVISVLGAMLAGCNGGGDSAGAADKDKAAAGTGDKAK